MEALTAASVAALTIVDMVKGMDKATAIENVRLIAKTGGKSATGCGSPMPRVRYSPPPRVRRARRGSANRNRSRRPARRAHAGVSGTRADPPRCAVLVDGRRTDGSAPLGADTLVDVLPPFAGGERSAADPFHAAALSAVS
jgi:hypothetical protein